MHFMFIVVLSNIYIYIIYIFKYNALDLVCSGIPTLRYVFIVFALSLRFAHVVFVAFYFLSTSLGIPVG
jgi:hypothetical protein